VPNNLNQLLENLNRAEPVFVTRTGEVETEAEAARSQNEEELEGRPPKPRTRLKPAAFGAGDVPLVRVSHRALKAMLEEAHRHPGETGGLLVGPRALVLTEFLPSGPQAKRTTERYELDVENLQPRLDEAQARGLVLTAIFHTHPKGCVGLSSLDVSTAWTIVNDPEWAAPRFVLPLAVRTARGFDLSFYVVGQQTPTPQLAAVVVLDEEGSEARVSEVQTTSTEVSL